MKYNDGLFIVEVGDLLTVKHEGKTKCQGRFVRLEYALNGMNQIFPLQIARVVLADNEGAETRYLLGDYDFYLERR